MMSQQHMEFDPGSGHRPASYSVGYEEVPYDSSSSSSIRGQKLLWQDAAMHATAGQRLALAIVSLVIFMVLILGLVLIAEIGHADAWVVLPILFILILYTTLAVIINMVFNRKS
jgi:fatty acid desaturase